MAFAHISARATSRTWNLGPSQTGEAEHPPMSVDFGSVQIAGTFGGAAVSLEVSNDGERWQPLADMEGDMIAVSAEDMVEISTAAAFIRPKTTGGSGTAVTVTLVLWA